MLPPGFTLGEARRAVTLSSEWEAQDPPRQGAGRGGAAPGGAPRSAADSALHGCVVLPRLTVLSLRNYASRCHPGAAAGMRCPRPRSRASVIFTCPYPWPHSSVTAP